MDFAQFVSVSGLLLALFLAVISERLVEYFASPLFKRQGWDTFYLRQYVGLVAGAALALAVGANAFAPEFIPVAVGKILTAAFVGGGSNLVHQITRPPQKVEFTELNAAKLKQGNGAS